MRAAVHIRYGPPEVVRVATTTRPVPAADEISVAVQASSVNRTDCGFRAGKPFVVRFFSGLTAPRRNILGCEFAGDVEAVGEAVTRFAVGDRVMGYDDSRFGGHGEYLTLPERAAVATMPPDASFAQAAVATEGSHYALSFIRAAGIRSGQRVLVNGATGAIGSAAVQLLAAMDAHVTAVAATDHLDLVLGLGAERVIDRLVDDFTSSEEPGSYDVVLDAVGKSTFGRCRRLLRPNGVYLSSELGPRGENPVRAILGHFAHRGPTVVFPMPKHDQEIVTYLRDQLAAGLFAPVVDRHYPLARIVDAYRYVESGQKIGNVVIEIR